MFITSHTPELGDLVKIVIVGDDPSVEMLSQRDEFGVGIVQLVHVFDMGVIYLNIY